MQHPPKVKSHHLAELFRRYDDGRALRERNLRPMVAELSATLKAGEHLLDKLLALSVILDNDRLALRDAFLMEDRYHEKRKLAARIEENFRQSMDAKAIMDGLKNAPAQMEPVGKAKKLVGTLLAKEEYDSLGSHFRRVADMGSQLSSQPKYLGKWLKPETLTVTTPTGIVKPQYRNQGGDPISDLVTRRVKTTARRYREEKRKFRKVIDGLSASAQAMPKVHTESLADANERTSGDYRRYFR